MNILSGASVVVTGGSGSFGHAFVRRVLALPAGPARVCILSRDELKQAEMRHALADDSRLRFYLGDVRDLPRLEMAFHGADVVIHAAALKRVDACEADPFEAVKTNVIGTQNVITAALMSQVTRVLLLSSDKACAPVNLYGATKATAEKLIVAANSYRGGTGPRFSAVRYGNVAGSRGSVIPAWRQAIARQQPIVVTEPEATRFWFTLDGAVDLVLWTLAEMQGGEVVVPRLPSFRIADLAEAIAPSWPREVNGHRAGDKTHESMVSPDEGIYFRDHAGRYMRFMSGDTRGAALPAGFAYSSDTNTEWLDVPALRLALQNVP